MSGTKYIAMFLFGVVTGSLLMAGLYLIKPPQADQDSAIMDELINDWTASNQLNASLQSRREISDARSGYIPQIVYDLSAKVDSVYSIPKGVVIAQWVLESKWGMADLGASNYFGHTYAAVRQYMSEPDYVTAREMVMQNGKIVPGDTVRFARYKNIRECFDVHGIYVTRSTKYRNAFAMKSQPESFARTLAKVYATDPEYGLKLVIIMRRYNLE